MMTATIDNKTTKVKKLREDRFGVFYCFSFVWVLFCGGSFLILFYTFIKL